MARKKCCLDAGHGGVDRYNVGPTGYVEADGCLDVVLRAGKYLSQNGVDVIYTRTGDYNLEPYVEPSGDLHLRAKIANDANADIFVSVHTNAGGAGANGTETYCFKTGGEGEKLAKLVQSELVKTIKLRDRGVKVANFAVLRLTYMPAILTELAFHSNPNEEELLKTSSFRDKAAKAISNGVLAYFGMKSTSELDLLIKEANNLKIEIESLNKKLKEIMTRINSLGGNF